MFIKHGRPCCYHCGKQLVYVHGRLSFKEYIDPVGNRHRLHKGCFDNEGYGDKAVTAQPRAEQ